MWTNIKDKWPEHQHTVLAITPKGYCVAVFVNSVIMNQELSASERVDTHKHPYYFVSQEVKGHTLNGVTHWMELPGKPF